MGLNKTAAIAYRGKVKEEWNEITRWFQRNDRNGDWDGTGRTKKNINYMLSVLKDWDVANDSWVAEELKKHRKTLK